MHRIANRWLQLTSPVIALAGALGTTACQSRTGGEVGAAHAGLAARDARSALAQAGFTVQEGRFEATDLSQCCLAGHTCAGNNPASPYLQYYLPPAPGQTAPNPPNANAPSDIPSDGSLTSAWRLRGDEALLFIGTTPPPSRYFSWDFYLFDRQNGQTRSLLWDSLGDSLNSGVVWTAGTPRGAAGDPSNRASVVIMTADTGTAATVRAALVASGYSDDLINLYVIPSSQVTFGLESAADDFNVLFRVALFDDAAQGAAWVQHPGATLLRLTPLVPHPLQPLPTPSPRAHATGVTEQALAPALDRLQAAIEQRYAALGTKSVAVQLHNDPNNPPCLDSGKNCLADNRDADYFGSDAVLLPKRDDAFVIAFGVNHQAAGKTWYSNFVPYNPRKLMGIASVDSRSLSGSAADYLPGDPDAPLLYAWKLARACHQEPHCLEVPYATCPGLPLIEPTVIEFRAYVDPLTLAAPAVSELLFDRVIRVGAP